MVFLLSLIADDSVSVWVFEGEGRGKVVFPAYRGKIEKQRGVTKTQVLRKDEDNFPFSFVESAITQKKPGNRNIGTNQIE